MPAIQTVLESGYVTSEIEIAMNLQPYLFTVDLYTCLFTHLGVGHLFLWVQNHALFGQHQLCLASISTECHQACVTIEGGKTGTITLLHATDIQANYIATSRAGHTPCQGVPSHKNMIDHRSCLQFQYLLLRIVAVGILVGIMVPLAVQTDR